MIEVISQSLIGQWTRCPEQVRRRYFENEIIPPGIAARIGTGVHKGGEVNHKAKKETGKDEPLDVIQDAARDGYVKSCKDGGVFFPPDQAPSAQIQLNDGVDTVTGLAKLYLESLAPKIVKPVLVEKRVYMDDPELPVPWAGTIDVATEDGWMPDLKTAAKRWSVHKETGACQRADVSPQITLYRELYKHETGVFPSKTSFEIFTKTKEPVHQSVVTTRMPGDFDNLKLRVKIMMQTIQAGIFAPADPESWICSPSYCGFYWTCRYIPAHKKILPKRSK